MNPRLTLAATIALATTAVVVAAPAQAEWKGLATFDCETSRANWNFDGLYGPYTTRAVKNFQRVRGIKVDGVTGPETCRSLGLRYRRTLRCGMGGNEVYMLQQALAASGFWYGGMGDGLTSVDGLSGASPWAEPPLLVTPEPALTPGPVSTPAPLTLLPSEPPSPVPTEPPTPAPTEAPVATPTPAETPAPLDTPPPPAPSPTPLPGWTPAFELSGSNWMLPLTAGARSYDLAFSRPTWNGGATAWFGDVGVSTDLTVFNETFVNYRDPAVGAFFVPNTSMFDLLARWRFERGAWQAFGGYRGVGQANVNFLTVGGAWERPLVGGWLWAKAQGQVGLGLRGGAFADGRAGLAVRIEPLTAEVGFRHFTFRNDADPLLHMNGPVIGIGAAF
ncbi:MAG: peptidoglycan-binding protein [Candidatus Sericytochromatia bacterium]|nr:peptidoglycan-binding protein [Candidatus Sericytochromatia bacterium]